MNTEKKITSYEDACKVLNIQPINEEVFNAFPKEDQRSMLAYHKLTVITRALNNGWKPNWDDQNEWKYYPLFRYVNAGLSYAYTNCAATSTNALSALGFAFPRPRSRNTQPNTLRTCTVTIIALLRKTEKRNKRKAAKKNPKATF
ncbi:hypothetical protein PO081_12485 [Bacteroides thetaiotaomicron]|uniref:hypothetical protein n=1 Tax=Bacteroides thetaiotaomicron TaxID=818 RepID=UPI00233025DA|nr:hypothetical protein [Bacteroides thetaiotaomicron]MDC2194107.1 hypothetical protein [Bacteroides thetaiotaomicron]